MQVLNRGWLEVILATLLATLSIVFDLRSVNTVTIWFDLAACLAAAATVWWPKAGSAALGVILASFLLYPAEWISMGEYAGLIPILGAGMRGNKRLRTVISVVYLVILTALQYHDYAQRGTFFLMAGFAWAVLIAACWVIGDVFGAMRRSQAAAHRAAMTEQRLTLARDLHDTVARSVTRLSLGAQRARASGDPADLDAVIEGVHTVGNELRWAMSALNDPSQTRINEGSTGSVQATISSIRTSLAQHGFPLTVTIEGGSLDAIPQPIQAALSDVLAEAAANIERHAQPGRPCALLGVVDPTRAEFLIINEHDPATIGTGTGMGLIGMRRRLNPHCGTINTRREDPRWTLHITVPLPAARSGSSSSMTISTSEPA